MEKVAIFMTWNVFLGVGIAVISSIVYNDPGTSILSIALVGPAAFQPGSFFSALIGGRGKKESILNLAIEAITGFLWYHLMPGIHVLYSPPLLLEMMEGSASLRVVLLGGLTPLFSALIMSLTLKFTAATFAKGGPDDETNQIAYEQLQAVDFIRGTKTILSSANIAMLYLVAGETIGGEIERRAKLLYTINLTL